MSIVVSHLLKVYGEQKAVEDLSFAVNKGEIVGFLGPNGAGKSTTMKILTGYLQADGGTAEVCGINVREQPLESKKKIGYLPEANPLYVDMYVREYLAFIAGMHHIDRKTARIEEVIITTGLTPESRKKVGQLSKGYKQRVGLAAALLHDPEVLILDEPTSGLDPNQIIEIRDVIKQLGSQKTVLFSSHILQEVQAICDRVIIINKGKLVADDQLSRLQQGKKGTDIVLLQLKETVAAADFAPLGVQAQQAGPQSWRFETTTPDQLRKSLLELAVEKGWNIVGLQSETQSLEDVFRALTQTNGKP
jgi:ABC-2 type transport system ATP-binding protein